PPRQYDDIIPRELERVCLKAMSKLAVERYSTAKDMADELRSFLAEQKHVPLRQLGAIAGPGEPVQKPVPTLATDAPNTDKPDSATTRPDSEHVRIVPKGLRSFDERDADFF